MSTPDFAMDSLNDSLPKGYTKDGRALFQSLPRNDTLWEEEF